MESTNPHLKIVAVIQSEKIGILIMVCINLMVLHWTLSQL